MHVTGIDSSIRPPTSDVRHHFKLSDNISLQLLRPTRTVFSLSKLIRAEGTMVPRLPLELIERIIDDVAEYDDDHIYKLSSIQACALVCHDFLPPCRKYIFASVTLNTAQRVSPPTSFDLNHLLSKSPHLAVCIRKLNYNVDEEEFDTERFSWLLPMFKKLVKLQKLSISYWRSGKLDWMLSSARKVLLTLLHLPTLTSISLSSIRNFSLADLASCVNLKKLRIQSLECLPPNGVGIFFDALPPTPVMLERLNG